jgi:hypothetical protein
MRNDKDGRIQPGDVALEMREYEKWTSTTMTSKPARSLPSFLPHRCARPQVNHCFHFLWRAQLTARPKLRRCHIHVFLTYVSKIYKVILE